jgi:hypothetical protein
MSARRLGFRLRLVALLCGVGCALAGCASLWVVPAQARVVHVFEGSLSFGSEGTGPGQFKEPLGVAVNDATHDVYVVDSANNRVEEFSSTGAYIREFNGSDSLTGVFSGPTQIAVDNSGNPLDPSHEDVYVVDFNHKVIDKFSATGAYEGQLTGTTCERPTQPEVVISCPKTGKINPFEEVVGVAVSPSGAVWVMEFKGNIENFSDGQPSQPIAIRSTGFGGSIGPGIAVDGEENLYMNPKPIAKVTSSGKELIAPFDSWDIEPLGHVVEVYGVAVDATHEEVYVDNSNTLGRSDLAGKLSERFGSGDLTESRGVAVDPGSGPAGSGTVYVTDRSADRVAVFVAVTLPTVSLSDPSEQTPRSLTLNGTVNPEGATVTSCVFEYDTVPYKPLEPAHGSSGPCVPAGLGSGTAPVAVSRRLEGLEPERKYYYRLVARNAGSAAGGPSEEIGGVTPGPNFGSEFVTEVTSASAALHTSVDPNGDNTHYYFEYGTTEAYGSYAPLGPPGVDLGAVRGVQALSPEVVGLQPGTVYHYRVVAVQNGEAFQGPDRTFTTQPRAATGLTLADGRAWELVSPANKGGALIEFLQGYGVDLQAASDGSGITYATFGQLGEGVVGHTALSHVLSVRSGTGWSSRDISLPGTLPPEEVEPAKLLGGGLQYRLFSPDLSGAAVEALTYSPPLSPEVSEACMKLYVRDNATGKFTPIVTPEMVPEGTNLCAANAGREQMQVYAATPDLTHFALWSPVSLTSGSYGGTLYEAGGGKVQPVGIYPDGKPFEQTSGSETDLAGSGSRFGSAQRAISNDGRWVAWTPSSPYSSTRPPNVPLYVRDMVAEKTVQVGGPQARYQTMNSDGSKIFFLENGDLYVCETAKDTPTVCPATDLTANHGVGETSGGVQEAVSVVNEDGSYVYFVATGVLAGGGVGGEPSLYLAHEKGAEWSLTHIATLSFEDEKDWYSEAATSATALQNVSARVSPDGRYVAFMSNRSLTGYDNIDTSSPPGEPRRDEEVYLYDALANRLVCASCNPTGARPTGVLDSVATGHHTPLMDSYGIWTHTVSGSGRWLAGMIPGWDQAFNQRAVYQPRYLSDSGRLFFGSPDALVPQATNGLADVYEYEPPGVGDCTSASTTFSERSGGCVNLISSGISNAESAFYDASENGDDVFFITKSKLVGADVNTTYDVYDAHVCSSAVPCHTEPGGSPPCDSGDSCKGAPSPQPEIFGPAPSATFSGAGNVTPSSTPVVKKKTVKCPKGKKLSHGRCIKAKAKHKTKAHKAKKATTNRRASR